MYSCQNVTFPIPDIYLTEIYIVLFLCSHFEEISVIAVILFSIFHKEIDIDFFFRFPSLLFFVLIYGVIVETRKW